MKALSKQDIFNSIDTKQLRVEVPEWGGYVHVKTMTGRERDSLEEGSSKSKGGITGFIARVVALTACDDDGKPLFTLADIPALNEKSSKALNRVFDASMELNAIGNKDVEEMAGNSPSTQPASSGST